MLSCRELAQQQASDFLEQRLGWRQRLQFRIHLSMCRNCRRFVQQLRRVRSFLGQTPAAVENETTVLALADRLHSLYQQQQSDPPKI